MKFTADSNERRGWGNDRELYQPGLRAPALLQQFLGFLKKNPLLNRRAQVAHQFLVVVQVVKRVQPRAEDLVGFLQVVEVGAREMAAAVARAALVERTRVVAMARVA